MSLRFSLAATAALLLPVGLFAQYLNSTSTGYSDAYQINYVTHLEIGDAAVNITNAGSSAEGNVPLVGGNTNGDICVNVYLYFSDQELATCCSCIVTPNALDSFSFITTSHALFPNGLPTATSGVDNHSYAIKLLSTHAPGGTSSGQCGDPSFGSKNTGNPVTSLPADTLAPGLSAWITHWHAGPSTLVPQAITETAFLPKGLSPGELGKLTRDCGVHVTNETGNFCPGCQHGGLAVPAPTL